MNDALKGTVERVTFFNPDNGYSVIKIQPDKKYPDAQARDGTVTVVGVMPEVSSGEVLEFTGTWITDARYGKQFKAEQVVPSTPSTEEGLVSYLQATTKGVGPKTAQKIVDYFGDQTIEVLDYDPKKILEIPGIKHELAKEVIRTWSNGQDVRRTMIYLQGYGVTYKMAERIFRHYGTKTVDTISKDPFALADDVFGIGFVRADEIAREMGLASDAHQRVRAGLQYALNQMSKEGHTFLPRQELIAKTGELLKIDNPARAETVLSSELLHENLIADSEGIVAGEAIYLPLYYHSERGAAKRIHMLNSMPSLLQEKTKTLQWRKFLDKISRKNKVDLTEQQQGAVQAALTNKVSVLTGGPGTGKTTTLRMVIGALEALDVTYALASPTGRAAKRLGEATDRPARTIHRLLSFVPGEGFQFDEDNPLEIEMLVIDESSMIDLLLFNDVLKALPPEAHLLLVGDVDQLPSVGAGNVLNDVISSQAAHVTRLDVIFRQAETSHIVTNAHKINRGDMPILDNSSNDFFFFKQEDPFEASQLVVDVVVNRLPAKFGVDPLQDVQVIAPMYRGPVGVNTLNEALQRALNGSTTRISKQLGGRTYRVGDKVMQTRNNYEKEVFNGDIGFIHGIDLEEQFVEVRFEDRYVEYDWIEMDELIHAYCISTHRSQGSEYPVVVMPVMTQHYMMLQRNLLYTAVTRAKQIVVLVGMPRAVAMAVSNNKVAERYSGLRARLQGRGE